MSGLLPFRGMVLEFVRIVIQRRVVVKRFLVTYVVVMAFLLGAISVNAKSSGHYQKNEMINGDYKVEALIMTWDIAEYKMYTLTVKYKEEKDKDFIVIEYVIFAKFTSGSGWEFGRGFASVVHN